MHSRLLQWRLRKPRSGREIRSSNETPPRGARLRLRRSSSPSAWGEATMLLRALPSLSLRAGPASRRPSPEGARRASNGHLGSPPGGERTNLPGPRATFANLTPRISFPFFLVPPFRASVHVLAGVVGPANVRQIWPSPSSQSLRINRRFITIFSTGSDASRMPFSAGGFMQKTACAGD